MFGIGFAHADTVSTVAGTKPGAQDAEVLGRVLSRSLKPSAVVGRVPLLSAEDAARGLAAVFLTRKQSAVAWSPRHYATGARVKIARRVPVKLVSLTLAGQSVVVDGAET